MSQDQIDQVRRSMLEQAHLFDDAYAYRCGVEDALAAVAANLVEPASTA